MSDRLETVVVVTDKGSQTFAKVGDSATKMGTSIDKATTTGSRGLSNLSKAGAVAGAAFTSLSGVLTLAAHANAEAEASHARLETAIEGTNHSLIEYQDQLDAASKTALQLGFDDEDAADSIAKMTTATGNAQTAIDDLSIAEDIARARKIDLASATNIVIAAEQGRTGALKRVGIEVDATMSKEQVMDALRAKFAGNAQAYSETTAAGYDRLKNAAENALESIGAHLGPAQELLLILPGLSAGFTGVGAAVGALAPEMTATAAAAGLLDIALGPVGIAALAIGAAAALFEFSSTAKEAFVPSVDDANTSAQQLNDTLKSLIETSSLTAPLAKEATDAFTTISTGIDDYHKRLAAAKKEQEDCSVIPSGEPGLVDEYAKHQQHAADTLAGLATEADKATISNDDLTNAQTAANDILTSNSKAAADSRKELKILTDEVNAGEITWSTYIKSVIGVDAIMDQLSLTAIETSDGIDKTAESTKAAADANKDYINTATGYRQSIAALGDQFQDLDGQTQTLATDHASLANAIATGNEMFKAEQAAAKQATDEFIKQAEAVGGLDTELEQLIAANVSTWAERTANRVLQSTQGLDSLMGVIIDGTKNLSGQSQNLNDWATDLIGVAGSYGKIDDLLAHGQITQTTYNQAQEAGTRIFADNAAVQEDLLRIQAKQAPLLADAADAQAKYIDQLADLPPQQELVALGWMDQNEAMKANSALALAAAAANGEYGAAGEAAATAAITAQAQADPAFAAMLEDMGLISVGADGTITVNFPDSETIQEAVDGLTASVDALTVALGGVPPNVNSNVTVTGVDSASAAVTGYSYLLDTVNGKSVYTSVYVDALGPGLRLTAPYGRDGGVVGATVPHYDTGGLTGDTSIVRMNEAGGELVRLPNNSLIYPAPASREMMRDRTGGGNITIHVHGDIVADDPRAFAQKAVSLAYAGSRG